MRAVRSAALVIAALACSSPAFAADRWAAVVAETATRDEAVSVLGKPEIEFTAFVPKGDQPLQISPSLPAPPDPERKVDFSGDDLLRVLEYRGRKRGLDWQVVLKDGKVWYCVAPPLADEGTVDALAKKFGKASIQRVDVRIADTLRAWDLIRYPKKNRVFVREPGAQAVVARVITR